MHIFALHFASKADYSAARRATFFGYLGAFGTSFRPDETLNRGEFAVIAAKVLRTPGMDGLTLTGTTTGTRFDQTLPVITHGQTLSVTGVENLRVNEILMSGPYVLEEWIEPARNYVRIGVALSDGLSLGTMRYVTDLATSPLTLDTNELEIRADTLLQLIVLIESEAPAGADMQRSGVAALYTIPVAVDFPDADGDGVRDDLDPWVDDWRFSSDSDGNGYPDNVDSYLAMLGIQSSDPVVIDGVAQGYTHGTALMEGYPPYDQSDPDQTDPDAFCWACLPNQSGWRAILPILGDRDQDGVPDTQDAFPLDPNEQLDTDGDGIGNNADTDDDGDGVADNTDNCKLVANDDQADEDGDGIGDACDSDAFCWECLPNAGGWRSILKP